MEATAPADPGAGAEPPTAAHAEAGPRLHVAGPSSAGNESIKAVPAAPAPQKPTERTVTRITGLHASMFKPHDTLDAAAIVLKIRKGVGDVSGAWRLGTRLMELYLRLALSRNADGRLPPNLEFRKLIRHCVMHMSTVEVRRRSGTFDHFVDALAVWDTRVDPSRQRFDIRDFTQCIDLDTGAYVKTLLVNYTKAGLKAHCKAFIRFIIADKDLAKRALSLLLIPPPSAPANKDGSPKRKRARPAPKETWETMPAGEKAARFPASIRYIITAYRAVVYAPVAIKKEYWDRKEAAAMELRWRMNEYLEDLDAAPTRHYVTRAGEARQWRMYPVSLIPHARKARKFLTFDCAAVKELVFAVRKREKKGEAGDLGMFLDAAGDKFLARMLRQRFLLPTSFKTDGYTVRYPFIRHEGKIDNRRCEVAEDDTPTDSKAKFKKSISGLFTLASVPRRFKVAPGQVVAVDPGIVNLVTTDAATNNAFTRERWYKGSGRSEKKATKQRKKTDEDRVARAPAAAPGVWPSHAFLRTCTAARTKLSGAVAAASASGSSDEVVLPCGGSAATSSSGPVAESCSTTTIATPTRRGRRNAQHAKRASKKKAAIEAIQAGLKERSLRVAGYEPFLANLAFLCVHERGATQVLRASDRDQRPDWCHSAPSARVRDGPELSQQAGLARRTHP